MSIFPFIFLAKQCFFTQHIEPDLKTDLGTPYCDHCHSRVLSNCSHDSKCSSKVAEAGSTVFPFITPNMCCLKQGDSFFSGRPFTSVRSVHWTRPSGPSFPSLSLFSSQAGLFQLPRHPCSCFCPEHEVLSVFPPSPGTSGPPRTSSPGPARARRAGARACAGARASAGPRSELLGFLICRVESSLSTSVSLINSSSRLHFSHCLSQWLQAASLSPHRAFFQISLLFP